MVSILKDPSNPDKLVLSVTATIYIDRIALEALTSEVEEAVRRQAIRDIKKNPKVQKAIAEAATRLLLGMLGVAIGEPDGKAENTGTNDAQ